MAILQALAHVCIKTSDLDATLRFYTGALGMEKVFDFTRRGEVIGFYLKIVPGAFVEVFHADAPVSVGADRCLHHFCLQVTDIEAARNRLIEHGHAPGGIKTGADQSLQFWVEDPNGLSCEFHQYTERSSQTTGQNAEVDW